MENTYKIFNRERVRMHRERAASTLNDHNFLLKEISSRLCERIADLKKEFPAVLDLGAHNGALSAALRGNNGIETLVQADLSYRMLQSTDGLRVVMDEELIPFAANTFDLAISAASMHWVNDLPGALIQINQVLKPGGMFIAILPGGETLTELRQSFEASEMELRDGVSPRVSPFIDVRDGGHLLQRAGFVEPVIDSELLTVVYEHPLKLLKDLRGMGESSALDSGCKTFTSCTQIMAMADHYLKYFSDEHGRIKATFELVTLTAFKP